MGRCHCLTSGEAGEGGQVKEERVDLKKGFGDALGEADSKDASEEEDMMLTAWTSTDQEELSRECGCCDFMVTLRSSVETL